MKYDAKQMLTREAFLGELEEIRTVNDRDLRHAYHLDCMPIVPPLVRYAPHHWYTLGQLLTYGNDCRAAEHEALERAGHFKKPGGLSVAELTGTQLDAAVALAMDFVKMQRPHGEWVWNTKSAFYAVEQSRNGVYEVWAPSTDWRQGGPIIQDAAITVEPEGEVGRDQSWSAGCDDNFSRAKGWSIGPTLLVAAMRYFVRTKLGESIDLEPAEGDGT